MDPLFEQASLFLDQALLSYAAGQIEEASRQMGNAAATLHAIELAPGGSATPAVAGIIKLKAITVVEFAGPSAGLPSAPAAAPAMDMETERAMAAAA